MCGIAGFFALSGSGLSEDVLQRMNATMIHRGPDQDGIFLDEVAGLAMRRLSIIGLGNGRQPIFNEDHTVGVVMNGEIYNYRELRVGLEARGHTFTTGSDVEVAVHLYEEHGPSFVRELRGMFGYALYDRRARRLVLGRDRAGKKPLYYARRNGLLLFASEIKALHASGVLSKEIDTEALESYLAHGFVVGERTLFAGINKLPAGCMLIAEGGVLRVERYWDVPMPDVANGGAHGPTFEEAASRVRELLDDAVRVRLMSEVPLGAFLSGGVDSSAIVALMSRHLDSPVETFAVGFADPAFDELAYARTAAEVYGTRHHELLVEGCSPDLLREVNHYHDEPAADPAAIPTFCLARFSRRHVTVALTGEGGDELFAGYRHYRLYHRLGTLEDRMLGVRTAAGILERLEPWAGGLGPRRLWKGLWITGLPSAERPRALVSVFTDADIDRCLGPELRRSHGRRYRIDAFRLFQARASDADWVAQSMYVDWKSQLADQLLMKVDKMTMAASLEARCPLLDQYLIEYVAALPTAMKISPAGTKLLLRHALRGIVPDALLDRPKHGFEVPIRRWLLGELAPLVEDLLLAPGAAVHRYLDPTFARTLWTKLRHRADNQLARQLWTLVNFAVWHEEHWPDVRQRSANVGSLACP